MHRKIKIATGKQHHYLLGYVVAINYNGNEILLDEKYKMQWEGKRVIYKTPPKLRETTEYGCTPYCREYFGTSFGPSKNFEKRGTLVWIEE